jgi:hypothetical protein
MSESHTCPDQAAFVADMKRMFDELDPETIRKYTSDVLRDMIETLRRHQVRARWRQGGWGGGWRGAGLAAGACGRLVLGRLGVCWGGWRCAGVVGTRAARPAARRRPPRSAPVPQVTLKSTVSTVVVTTLVLEGWSSKLNPDLLILDRVKDMLAMDWRDRVGRAVDKIMAGGQLAVM